MSAADLPGPRGTRFKVVPARKRAAPGRRLLQQLARLRCDRDFFCWPLEVLFTRWLVPAQKLS